MRDQSIIESFNQLEAKVSHDMGLLVQNFAILECREKALEALLLSSRWSLLRVFMLSLISPRLAQKVLSAQFQALYERYREKKVPRTGPARSIAELKSALVMPLVVLMLLSGAGCVSSWKYDIARSTQADLFDRATKAESAAEKARADLQYCQDQQTKLVEILKKFNQVDANGQIRTKSPVSESIEWTPTKGKK